MSAHQLPKAVAAALQGHKHAQADVNGANGMAWVLSANVLHLWKYQDGPRATVHTHGLPYALPGQCHVAVVQHQVSPPFTASMVAATQGPASLRQACSCAPLQNHETALGALHIWAVSRCCCSMLWHEGPSACRMQDMCQ